MIRKIEATISNTMEREISSRIGVGELQKTLLYTIALLAEREQDSPCKLISDLAELALILRQAEESSWELSTAS